MAPSSASRRTCSPSSTKESPRLTYDRVGANRISSPLSRTRRQDDLSPAEESHGLSLTSHASRSKLQTHTSGDILVIGPQAKGSSSSGEGSKTPKLHHIHGTPKAKDYPYMHKSEVKEHLVAVRAGSPSLLDQGSSEPGFVATTAAVTDYSETVYYSHQSYQDSTTSGRCTIHVRSHAFPQPRHEALITQEYEHRGDLAMNHSHRTERNSRETDIAQNYVYLGRLSEHSNRRDLLCDEPRNPGSNSTFSRQGTTTAERIGARRLELRGGIPDVLPRLRGGSGQHYSILSNFALRFKTWVLLGPCSKENSTDTCCDTDPPSARVPAPKRIAVVNQMARGSIAIPSDMIRSIA